MHVAVFACLLLGLSAFECPNSSDLHITYYALCRLLHGIQRPFPNAQLRYFEAPERSPGVRRVTFLA
jgi:hypothetical protein